MTYANTIKTSTALLDHFVCCGTYETYLGEYTSVVARSNREAMDAAIGKLATDTIAEALWDVLPYEVRDEFECEYVEMFHPQYYNFTTDAAEFNFNYSDEFKNWLFDYATENNDGFKKFLGDNYAPRSGFIPYTPDNWDEWLDGWNKQDNYSVSALINFLLQDNADYDDYQMSFDEAARTIIEENFIPWEYAEKYENGWVGVCKGEWDDDEQATVYTGWLLDADGNVIATDTIDDPYDDDFKQSAYAAWEYSDLGYSLTKDRVENRWKSVECDVPETVAA